MGKSNEQIISEFLRSAYTDEKLAALLAHAEDGKLSWHSCCCLLGAPTADHALHGLRKHGTSEPHYAKALVLWGDAPDRAFMQLSALPDLYAADTERRAKLIPLIKAEMRRREQERSSSSPTLVTTGVEG